MARPALPLAAADLLPADVEALLRDALARVAGRPRELLSDLARMARPLMASLRREGDPAALGDSLAELLRAACATAREVHRLESTASTVTTTLDAGAGSMDDRLRLAAGRCRTGAETGTRRLIEAVAAVGDAGSRAAPDTASGSRLAQLTRQLTDDVRHHEDTLRELDSLLAR
jgi:hypothetical protein